MKKFFTCLLATMLITAPTLFSQSYGQSLAESNYPPFNQNVSLDESNLPIVIITTPNVLDRDDRVMGRIKVINNVNNQNYPDGKNYLDTVGHPNQTIECDLPIALKWRGNTSFGGTAQTKKPISLKTLKEGATKVSDKKQKVSLLGMGEDNDWALLAPWQDKSYVRDILTMVMAKGGSTFAPQMRYCEVVFNNIYYGVYILSERATKGVGRLNIWDYGEGKDAEGNKITFDDPTGDFHVEIDRPEYGADGTELFYTSPYYPVNTSGEEMNYTKVIYLYEDPEYEDFATLGITPEETVDKAIADMEDSFAASDYKKRYSNYIDITSFIDYEIAQEVSNNIDAYRLSTPMWKYSKTHAQISGDNDRWKIALWDFNIAYGHSFGSYFDPSRADWRYTANDIMYGDNQLIPFYWYKLMNDNAFIDQFKARYAERRQKSYSNARVQAICDSLKAILNQGAVSRDNNAWNRNFSTWQTEISKVVSFTQDRLSWMDTNIELLAGTPDDPDEPTTTGPAVPLAIADGYNMDVICESKDNMSSTVTTDGNYGIDNLHYVYYTTPVRDNGVGALCDNDGLYSSENAQYYINVAGNNALVMKENNQVTGGTLTLKSPAKLQKIYVTGTSADGTSNVNVTVNYKDGTSSSTSSFYMPDWGGTEGATVVVTDLGRMLVTDGTFWHRDHFSIFEIAISTDASKEVKSVSFLRTSGTSTAIFSLSGVYATTDFQLAGTTFWKDNSWNTLCLPFDVDDITDTPLEGAIVKTLESSDFNDGALSLTFTSENLTSLKAGVPYIMKWEVDNEDKDYDPTFEGVILKDEEEHPAETKFVDYIGKFNEIKLNGGDNSVLYLGANNTLYYPAEGHNITINPYHAYFKLKDITAGDGSGAKSIRSINIDFNDDPQGIQTIVAPTNELIDYWYTLDGLRLDEKPTARGIYLHQGRRVMIK